MQCASPATRSGRPCGYQIERCPYLAHAASSADPSRHGIQAGSQGPRPAGGSAPTTPVATPAAVTSRNLRDFAWWAAGALLSGELQGRDAAAVCSLIRTLHALGPEPADEEDVLAEIELRGVVMNGFPPRNEEEWALAERVFNPEAIEEFHRWETLGKGW